MHKYQTPGHDAVIVQSIQVVANGQGEYSRQSSDTTYPHGAKSNIYAIFILWKYVVRHTGIQ